MNKKTNQPTEEIVQAFSNLNCLVRTGLELGTSINRILAQHDCTKLVALRYHYGVFSEAVRKLSEPTQRNVPEKPSGTLNGA